MVQTNGLLFLRTDKGRQNLVFYHNSYDFNEDLQPLGFSRVLLDRDSFGWERAFHPSHVEQLQNLYGPLGVDVQLQAILEKSALSNIKLADLSVLGIDEKDYQREAIAWLSTHKKAFLALAPGLGKSLCALRSIEAAGYSYIHIIAPLSLLENWRKEIERWLPDSRVLILRSGDKVSTGTATARHKIILMSYESFKKWYQEIAIKRPPELMIFDESILLKNRQTKRVRTVLDLLKTYKGAIWLLSGGPVAKFLDDLWSQLHILDKRRFSSYHQFKYHYCQVQQSQWGDVIIANKPGAVELLSKDLADIYYAKTQDQVENLPEFIFERIEVPMDENQAKIYSQMEKEFLASLPSGDEVLATSVLTQMLRLTQIASNSHLLEDEGVIPISSAKWDAVASLLEFAPKPVLIWTNFIRTASLLGVKLQKQRVATLTGQVDVRERQSIVDEFQKGNLDVLIAHPAVGKYGHTLTKARSAIYVERSYNSDDFYQSLYRIRRIGTKESPQVFFVLSLNGKKRTVDHAIDAVLQYRHDNNIQMITSGELRAAWEGIL